MKRKTQPRLLKSNRRWQGEGACRRSRTTTKPKSCYNPPTRPKTEPKGGVKWYIKDVQRCCRKQTAAGIQKGNESENRAKGRKLNHRGSEQQPPQNGHQADPDLDPDTDPPPQNYHKVLHENLHQHPRKISPEATTNQTAPPWDVVLNLSKSHRRRRRHHPPQQARRTDPRRHNHQNLWISQTGSDLGKKVDM